MSLLEKNKLRIYEYQCLILGLIFGISSWALNFTLFIPVITMLPASILEGIYQGIFEDKPFRYTGIFMIWTLILFFIISIFLWYIRMKRSIKRKNQSEAMLLSFFFFSLQIFILHPLFFYFSFISKWYKASDGQAFFGIYETYPYSSAFIIFLGIVMNIIYNTAIEASPNRV